MEDNLKNIIYKLHPIERKVLPFIEHEELEKIAKESQLTIEETKTAVQMLEEKGYAIVEKLDTNYISLDKYGKKYLNKKLPEIKLLEEVIKKPKKVSQLKLSKEEFNSAIGILKNNNLVNIKKEKELIISAKDYASSFIENFYNPLELFKEDIVEILLTDEQKEVYNQFKNRKGFLKKIKKTHYNIILTPKGEEISQEIKKKYMNLNLIETLDSSMLKTGSWKNKTFRHYETNIDVPIQDIGRRHPMIKANNILRDIFVEMGFQEMVGPMVESEFWCFDALWIPQDHPARDDQDTFFLDGIAQVEDDIKEKVRTMHEEGLKKGHTPKGEWSSDITKRRILRTHSTATSFRYLYNIGKKYQKGEYVDGKYFYVANNFRNETTDSTHLAEFFQAEGFIIGDNLSLADLMGFVKKYYEKLGIKKIRFKPTFNPYTEPSMEAHYYDEKMGKWYALINSGIFRRETLKPMGLENKTIIAWGMGASRVAALLSRKDSMRDITGATCDFKWLRERPIMKRQIVRK
ncbi:MAG: phenylalanine--tRNA ligase subunit alpha [Nanoarchaeota archaeon]